MEENNVEPRAGASLVPAEHGRYLSEIFNIDREVYFDWLEYATDQNDSPYLGTKYVGGDFRNPKDDHGEHNTFRVGGRAYKIPNNTPGSYGVGNQQLRE